MKNSLRYHRKKARLTLEKLSKISGLALSTIGNVETGKSEPGPEFIQKICSALKISEDQFMSSPPEEVRKSAAFTLQTHSFSHQENPDSIREEPPDSHWERRALNAEAKLDALTAAMEALLNRFKMR